MENYIPHPIDESNDFGNNLKKYWTKDAHLLVFASDPSIEKISTHVTQEIQDAFTLSGFSLSEARCFDNRYIEQYALLHNCDPASAAKEALKESLLWADVFFLAGGHAPTENAFMKRCGLKEFLHDPAVFDGIFLSLSAGMVNAADPVYLIPELPGESIDPSFVRFTDGLGFTKINAVPHIDYLKNFSLDGSKLIQDIVSEDSHGRTFYLISDGSYFMIRNGITEFFGDGMIMENGITRPLLPGIIHRDDTLFDRTCHDIFDTCVTDHYDWILELDAGTGNVHFFYVSNSFLERGIVPVNIDSFDELVRLFSLRLVVEDERTSCLEQMQISNIVSELSEKGSFVRTIHIDTESGINAESLRISRYTNNTQKYLVCLTDISMILDHDWMTDEYSRSGFLARAEKLLLQQKYQSGYSIVYANIQGFKAVNDLLGTQSGDMVIFHERDALVKELSPILIARLESDHFALIAKTDAITPESMQRLSRQCYIEGTKRLPIRIRCGIYAIEDPSENIPHMLDRAKLAEESISSDHGISYAICNEKMSRDYVDQQFLISEIDAAFEKNEFIPYYQPIVDAQTGKIVSAEALIRWRHSERGMISPGQFIPIFEKEGLTTKIDTFMTNRILTFNTRRQKEGKPSIPCAVNLSRVDFYDTKLLDLFRRQLSNITGVQNMLKLEVTESAYAVLESDAIAFLEEMKRLQLSLLLDDFGSGMSSLSTLGSLEFDTVKLDMGFIARIGKSKKAESIIQHTIGMSHDMGAKIIAEGVETAEQLHFLQSVGCDMIQGYYFYKPMPEEEFECLLDQ